MLKEIKAYKPHNFLSLILQYRREDEMEVSGS